jgi:hypothetical protein
VLLRWDTGELLRGHVTITNIVTKAVVFSSDTDVNGNFAFDVAMGDDYVMTIHSSWLNQDIDNLPILGQLLIPDRMIGHCNFVLTFDKTGGTHKLRKIYAAEDVTLF